MDARAITKALGGKWAGRYGLARCPVHADKTPSLKVTDDKRKDDGIDVVCFAGCDWKLVKGELRRHGLLPTPYKLQVGYSAALLRTEMLRDVAPKPPKDDTAERADIALKLWSQALPITGTPAETYFKEHRGLAVGGLDLGHALRWHSGAGAIIAQMTDPITNKMTGVHRTFLNSDGTKRERKMLGQQGVVRVSPDEDVTYGLGLTEGVEDALSFLVGGWAPVWAATSAGAMAKFPVLSGIEALTIFPDNDKNGTGMRAAVECAERWTAAGREVFVR
jgi:putative DNA primase/helicase